MKKQKYKLPEDLKWHCIWLVRGHERRVALYNERRNAVLHGSSQPAIVDHRTNDGEIIGVHISRGSGKSDPTAGKAIKLEKIENMTDTKIIRAVEQSKFLIGTDCDERQRQRLATAIWDSCVLGRDFIFDYYDVPMDKATFYRRRMKFLWSIALLMDFVHEDATGATI